MSLVFIKSKLSFLGSSAKPLLVLVDQLSDWAPYYPNQVLCHQDYLRDYAATKGYVINLCRDYSYLGTGYYGSLLAEARGGHNVSLGACHHRTQ